MLLYKYYQSMRHMLSVNSDLLPLVFVSAKLNENFQCFSNQVKL